MEIHTPQGNKASPKKVLKRIRLKVIQVKVFVTSLSW